jgi:hypothetical protein
MPSLEDFIESLTQEKTKLINMGKIKGPNAHALIVKYGSHKYHKYKDKGKSKSHVVGTRGDPGFNSTTTHQQNPNYRPFRQHLRSR